MVDGRVKVSSAKVSSGISECTNNMSDLNVKLSYSRS
ncbi:BgTH12-01593 [Blumeria graminis f. sp. triticale]|uniref:Bgt-50202 n=2 Tax=Blumeria graminis TaxID=34373 RepID=A0A9X9QBS7_BLUGR|nr:BgTH12-01593 [Blumeria graminis f. sp. triticale]VDB83830.1 Bgt-50202 [Blumeria graminis f. sp. tritici]